MMEFVVRSPERFLKEMQVLEEINADIIGLNEVTGPFLKLLQEQPWVRKNYFLSDILSSKGTESKNRSVFSVASHEPMGNLILSRYPFHKVFSYSYSTSANCPRNTILGSFFQGQLLVCSAHITAYVTMHERRATQMREFVEYLITHLRLTEDESHDILLDNVIIMGDLNLHSAFEDKIIPDIGFTDFWKKTDMDPDGFTWDTTKNGMIHLFQMIDNRRMRLDRIIGKLGCQWQPRPFEGEGEGDSADVILFATEPVYPGSYLQCSDHFGLYTNLLYVE